MKRKKQKPGRKKLPTGYRAIGIQIYQSEHDVEILGGREQVREILKKAFNDALNEEKLCEEMGRANFDSSVAP